MILAFKVHGHRTVSFFNLCICMTFVVENAKLCIGQFWTVLTVLDNFETLCKFLTILDHFDNFDNFDNFEHFDNLNIFGQLTILDNFDKF